VRKAKKEEEEEEKNKREADESRRNEQQEETNKTCFSKPHFHCPPRLLMYICSRLFPLIDERRRSDSSLLLLRFFLLRSRLGGVVLALLGRLLLGRGLGIGVGVGGGVLLRRLLLAAGLLVVRSVALVLLLCGAGVKIAESCELVRGRKKANRNI
jgi:hypothetical protein